jgi:hypothetical protein
LGTSDNHQYVYHSSKSSKDPTTCSGAHTLVVFLAGLDACLQAACAAELQMLAVIVAMLFAFDLRKVFRHCTLQRSEEARCHIHLEPHGNSRRAEHNAAIKGRS